MKQLGFLVAITSLAAAPLFAQTRGTTRSTTEKFFASFALNGAAIRLDDLDGGDGSESGGGASLQLGYGFNRRFAMFIDGATAVLPANDSNGSDFTLNHVDIGARYSFANPAKAFVPYIEAALTGRGVRRDDVPFGTTRGDVEYSGGAFTLGGGFNYFFNRSWAFMTALKVTTGEFSTVKFESVSVDNLDIDATTTRLNFGVSWFPRD
jgi:hypothetical protein